MSALTRIAVLLTAVWLTLPLWAAAANTPAVPTFSLHEHLGESWMGERISFPATIPQGMDIQHLAVREAGGTMVPAQFVPNTAGTRTGQLYFVVNLQPNAKQVWKLVDGKKLPGSDISFQREADTAVLGTARIAVRCPMGTMKWPAGKPASDVPAPITAVRLIDGEWAGAGTLHSPLNVVSFTGEVVATGPVFTRIRQAYAFAGGKQYITEIEVIAGQPVVLISEKSNLNEHSDYLEGIRPSNAPNGNYTMMAYNQQLYEQGSYWTFSFTPGFSPDRIALHNFYGLWEKEPVAGEPKATYPLDKTPGPVVTLNPSNGEWWMNAAQWAGVYRKDGNSFLAMMALSAGAWKEPHKNVIVWENDTDGNLRGVLPINYGSRRWGLFACEREAAVNLAGEEPDPEKFPGFHYVRPAQEASLKYGLLPLDTVKNWTLEFPDPQGTVFPHIYANAKYLPTIRRTIAEHPELHNHVENLKQVWDNYRQENDPQYPYFEQRIVYARGLDNIYLATGDETYAQPLAKLLIERLHYYIHQTKAGVGITGYRWGHGYGMFNLTTGALPISTREADIALGSPSVTPAQKKEIRALLAFWGELFASRDYFAPGYNNGNTDMVTSYYEVLGKIASVINGHPKAKAWAEKAAGGLQDSLAHNWHIPGADQDEWYGSLTLEMITQTAMCLKQAGLYDLFSDPSYRKGLIYYAQLTVPTDPRTDTGYIIPFGNGQGNWNRSAMWAVAASGMVQDDPDFAARLMWVWERSGKPGQFRTGDYPGAWTSLGWINPAIKSKNPQFPSKTVPGWGVIFRNGCGTPQETYLAMQVGKASGLTGVYNAEGGMWLNALGQPLCVNFGLRSYDVSLHEGNGNLVHQRWMANRPSFDFRSEINSLKSDTGSLLSWAGTSTADMATGEWSFNRLFALRHPGPDEGDDQLKLSKPRPEVPGLKNGFYDYETVDPITWRRHILFVKDKDPAGPNYFLFRDSAQCKVPWDWSIWSLASDLQVNQNAGSFTGKFGVDLDLVPLTQMPELVTGSYGPTESFAGDWHQKLYQAQFSGSGEMAAVLYPHKHDQPAPAITAWAGAQGAKVVFPDATHYLLMADQPQQIRADGMLIVGRAAVIIAKADTLTLNLLSGVRLATHEVDLWSELSQPTEGNPIAVILDRRTKTLRGESHGAVRNVHLVITGIAVQTLIIDGKKAAFTKQQGGNLLFTLPKGDHTFTLK